MENFRQYSLKCAKQMEFCHKFFFFVRLSVLFGIAADSDRRWAIKLDTPESFAP